MRACMLVCVCEVTHATDSMLRLTIIPACLLNHACMPSMRCFSARNSLPCAVKKGAPPARSTPGRNGSGATAFNSAPQRVLYNKWCNKLNGVKASACWVQNGLTQQQIKSRNQMLRRLFYIYFIFILFHTNLACASKGSAPDVGQYGRVQLQCHFKY